MQRSPQTSSVTLIAAGVAAALVMYRLYKNNKEQQLQRHVHGCLACNIVPRYPDNKGHMDNVGHPLFNVREVCKQFILLEHHLFNPRERCPDCIRKHFIHAEALMEEALSLDTKHAYPFIQGMPQKIRMLIAQFAEGVDPSRIAQAIRELRKSMLQKCFYIKDPSQDKSLQL